MNTRCIFLCLSVLAILGCKEKESPTIKVKSVTVVPSEKNIHIGETVQLEAVINPSNATNQKIVWSSETPGVAAVSDEGAVTGVSLGWTAIYAIVDGIKGYCKVTVIKKSDDGALKGGIEELTEDEEIDMTPKHHRVGILGDSISTFEGTLCNSAYSPFYPKDDPNVGVDPDLAVDRKEKTYWWRLIYEYMPNAELDANSSWGGTRVVHEVKKDIGAGFVDRAYDFVNPDIIIIHGGTNDKNQSTPLGEYDWDVPVGEGDLSCFRSAYVQLVKMLQEKYEGVQLILLIGDTLTSGYENSILEIARHFGLPYVDFVGASIPKCKGSHPTAQGMSIMAERIYNTCKDYLQ